MTNRVKRILQILTISLLAFVGVGAWAVSSPVGSSPDEDYHLVSIWCSLGEREGLCAGGLNPNQVIVSERLSDSSSCFAHDPRKSAFCNLDDQKLKTVDRWNSQGEYPPVFYSFFGLFASPDITSSTLIMRLLNVAIFVGLTFAVFVQLPPGKRGPLVWAGIATLVPLGIFLIASINPSSWAIISGLLLWISLYGFLIAESLPRKVGLGISSAFLCLIGSGSRGDSAVFVAFSALVAIILTYKNSKIWYKKASLPLAIIVFSALMFLSTGQGTETARSTAEKFNTDSSQSSSVELISMTGETSSGMSLLMSNFRDLPWLWTGGTGTWGLGWLDTPVAASVWIGQIGVVFTLFIWGLNFTSLRKSLALVLAVISITAFPLYVLQGKDLHVGEFVQPRYLIPLLVISIGISLLGFSNDSLGLNRLQSALIFGTVGIANSLSLHTNMRRYITGIGDGGINLNLNIEWWWKTPISPMLIWSIGSFSFLFMLIGIWLWLFPLSKPPYRPTQKLSGTQAMEFSN